MSDLKALIDAARRVAGVSEDTVRDEIQGLCVFCGEGWERVPGPRGGKGKVVNTQKHHQSCPFDNLRKAYLSYTSEPDDCDCIYRHPRHDLDPDTAVPLNWTRQTPADTFGVPRDGKWYEVSGWFRNAPYGAAEIAVKAHRGTYSDAVRAEKPVYYSNDDPAYREDTDAAG